MADVYAIFGTLLALGITFPGFLTAWWLLFPKQVAIAGTRVERTPWRCLGTGLLAAAALVFPALLLAAVPLPFSQLLAAGLLIFGLAVAALGAAGIAATMARRLSRRPDAAPARSLGTFVLAAVALELAVAFPFIGWFLVLPITVVMSLGSAIYGMTGRLPSSGGGAAEEPPETRLAASS